MKQVLPPTAALTLALLAGTASAQDDSTLSTVVVTGNRGAEQRTVTSSPVPIDVVSAKQLQNTGKPGLMEALSAVIPSLTLPEKTGWDASGIARAPNLWGLSAAEVLVLVNGKRRHTSATLNINGINTGAAPADLDLIPISAIDHVEVLRDGAAAQYGSDAIAGVINVILKADTSGTSVTNAGLGYDGKKQTVQQSLNKGFEIGNGGIVQLALDARSQNDDNKASANGYTYAQAYEQAGRSTYGGYGTPKTNLLTLGYNAELPVDDNFSLYSSPPIRGARPSRARTSACRPSPIPSPPGPTATPAATHRPGLSTKTTSRPPSVAKAPSASGTGTCPPPTGATTRSRAPPTTKTRPWAKPRRTTSPPARGFPPS